MSKRLRHEADEASFELQQQRKARYNDYDAGSSSRTGVHDAGAAPHPHHHHHHNANLAPLRHAAGPSHKTQWQDDVDFPDFDAAMALSYANNDGSGDDECGPVASGSRPRELPRTMDERFVPGLQTFVGGLTMSRPLHERPNATARRNSAAAAPPALYVDSISIEPPPLEMSRNSISSQRSSSPPRPSLDGTVRISLNEGLAEPPSAPLVPGVSPGWHVESHGRQAMELHDGVRYRDEEGWTPLEAFPARTREGRYVAALARQHLRHLRGKLEPSFDELYTPKSDSMSLATTRPSTTRHPSQSNEVFTEASTSKQPMAAFPPIQPSAGAITLPPISSISTGAILDDEDLTTLSPIEGLMSSSSWLVSPKNSGRRRASGQSSLQSHTANARPASHIWFNNGAPTTAPRPPTNGALHPPTSQRAETADPLAQHRLSASSPPASCPFALRDFEVLETLGTGTFGRVLLVRLKCKAASDPSAYFALKVLAKSEVVRLKQVEHTNSERSILSSVSHPFLVNLITTFQDSKNAYMLMDYVIGGEIFSYLRRAGRFSVDVTRFYISTIVLAIEYLHDRNIIYRDLKPENLLLDETGYTKITDFGFAKQVEDRTWTLCGTPEYLAPEIIQSKGHGKAVDWWALGILAFEMLAGYPPFYDNQPFGVYEKILQGSIVFPAHIDEVSRDLIRSLLTADRSKRLGNLRGGAQDVKNHWWFAGVDWEALRTKRIRPPIVPINTRAGDTANFSKYDSVRMESLPGLCSASGGGAMAEEVDPHAHLFVGF